MTVGMSRFNDVNKLENYESGNSIYNYHSTILFNANNKLYDMQDSISDLTVVAKKNQLN